MAASNTWWWRRGGRGWGESWWRWRCRRVCGTTSSAAARAPAAARPLDAHCLAECCRPDRFPQVTLGHHIHAASKQLLESDFKTDQIEQCATRFERHQEVHVTAFSLIA